MRRIAIAVHGGAGRSFNQTDLVNKRVRFLKTAVKRGYEILERGGSALEAVEAAVIVLEDSGYFNAGLGSCLTFDGVVEMDAGIMDGKTGAIGAVAAVRCVKNPIVLARKVMELTDHILVVGEGADRLAEAFGMKVNQSLLVTPEKIRKLRDFRRAWQRGEAYNWLVKLRSLYESFPQLFGTVGAVALDLQGNVAAASSTGGYWLKLRGRVGDTPIPGAGFYADNKAGACSATGVGEAIIRTMLCYTACNFMEHGMRAQEAANAAISHLSRELGEGLAGIVTVDRYGNVGYSFNTEIMFVGYMTSELDKAEAYYLSSD